MNAPNSPRRPLPLPIRRSAGGLRLALLAVGCLVCLLVAAAPAAADSIVYVKESNVWLANPDGSGQYQVTGDGTADHPWRTPSQADDGTIAAAFGNEIVRMRQNGEVLNRIDPPTMLDSAGDPVDGPPIDVAISPDGSRIAYTMADYACPEGADCDSRTVTAYTAADHLTPPQEGGITYLHDPSWVTSSRTLQFGGFTHQVDIHDFGQPSDVHWFDDYEVVGQENATDLGDGELNPQGTRLALVRGYGSEASVVWYDVGGDARGGLLPAPSLLCATGSDEGINGPTWSPDGQSLAMADPQGIWVKREAGNCEQPQPALVIPGGAHPDWGPAAVNPAPRAPEHVISPEPPKAKKGCAAQTGAKHDRCLYGEAVRKCRRGPKGHRGKCLAAARRAYAVRKCSRGKKGAARARCIHRAQKGHKS